MPAAEEQKYGRAGLCHSRIFHSIILLSLGLTKVEKEDSKTKMEIQGW